MRMTLLNVDSLTHRLDFTTHGRFTKPGASKVDWVEKTLLSHATPDLTAVDGAPPASHLNIARHKWWSLRASLFIHRKIFFAGTHVYCYVFILKLLLSLIILNYV
jgi:hypothetical protein